MKKIFSQNEFRKKIVDEVDIFIKKQQEKYPNTSKEILLYTSFVYFMEEYILLKKMLEQKGIKL